MRHVGSLIAGMLIAPLAWLLIAIGQQKSAETVGKWVELGAFDSVDLLLPAAYLLGAGLIIGLIATLRISPAGPIVAGLALLATYVSLFIDPLSALNSLKKGSAIPGLTVDLTLPITNGTTAVLGLALLVAAASVKRWRAWPAAVALGPVGADAPSDIHEYPLGQGPGAAAPVAARPPYGGPPVFPAATTSVLPAAGGFGAAGGIPAPASDETQRVPAQGTPPVSGGAPARYPAFAPTVASGPPAPVVSGPPLLAGPPLVSGPPVVSGPPAPVVSAPPAPVVSAPPAPLAAPPAPAVTQPAPAGGQPSSPPGPFPPAPAGVAPQAVPPGRFDSAASAPPPLPPITPPPAAPPPAAPPAVAAPPGAAPSGIGGPAAPPLRAAGRPGDPAWLTPEYAPQPLAGGTVPPGAAGPAGATPWSGTPAGARPGFAGSGTSELPIRPPTVPVSPPPPYGGGQPATSPAPEGAIAYSRGASTPPATGDGATEPFGVTQPTTGGAAATPPVSTPPVSAPPVTAPPASARPAPVSPASAPPGPPELGPSGSWPVVPAPGGTGSSADEDATRPLHTGGPAAATPSGLPSRAARGPVAGEHSILDGPSFDGFAVPSRPGRDTETEAFHPGHQSPVPSRPRHAAPGETGEDPAASVEGQESDQDKAGPRGRFQPMAPLEPVVPPNEAPAGDVDTAEPTTTVLTTPPATGFGPATSAPKDDVGEATTWFRPPSEPVEDAEATANFGFGGGAAEQTERRAGAPSELERLAGERAAREAVARKPGVEDGSADGDATEVVDTRPRRDTPPTSPWAQPPRDRG
ncbi:hypothetical protein ABT297_05355 [Dactylosporangium sp. NPDC000555]|uniref:hypothetical protein n=1 Tax=Dactylosporangium sp. NPDC000555 TaxID=3154260 RepID=UPI003326059F